MSILNISKKSPEYIVDGHTNAVEDILSKFYPGYPWSVDYNKDLNVFIIKNIYISLEYGMTSKNLARYQSFSAFLLDIRNYGGELLERAKLPFVANQYDIDLWVEVTSRTLNTKILESLDKSI